MSFGSTRGAIVSLKNNRRNRKSKTEKFLRSRGSATGSIHSCQKPTQAEIEELGRKISAENKKRQRKILAITAVFLIISGVVFFYYF
ncbi:MAG: hypothetical protein WCE57_11085 [Salegentibacter sp.]